MPRLTGLWRHPDFLKLWCAQTLAALSANVTNLALPLIAALTLHATPFEMGLLSTIATLPNILVGLFAGAWADRARRRPIMIAADLARAILLLSIPLATLFGLLTIWQLYAVLFLSGICTTFFDVANVSYLPSLVGRVQLVNANSRIVASASVANAAGPGLAGGLIQLLTAPIALLVDAGTLAASAVLILAIRSPEAKPAPESRNESIWHNISSGIHPLYRDPMLRSVVGSSMIYLFFSSTMLAVYVLYATRDLHIAPAILGAIFAAGGAGALLGALVAASLTRQLRVGRVMIGANLLSGLFILLIPLAPATPAAALLLGIAQFVSQMMGAIFSINQTSLLQIAMPDHLRGRVNASYRFLTMGSLPLGSLLGGALGASIGLRATLAVGGLGMLLPVVWLALSPLRRLTSIEAQEGPSIIVASEETES
jgi:MFS family permease